MVLQEGQVTFNDMAVLCIECGKKERTIHSLGYVAHINDVQPSSKKDNYGKTIMYCGKIPLS